MDINSLNSASALSQYATSLLARQQAASGGSTQSSDALMARLTAAPTDFKSETAQHNLDKQQAALGQELAAGLAKAGVKLGANVSFSVGSDGAVSVDGSDADKTAVANWFKSDTSNPSLQSRISSTLQAAQTLSASTQQNNAISLAARYGGVSANVMAMYTQFMGHTDSTPAVMSFDGSASTLSYPGALDSQA